MHANQPRRTSMTNKFSDQTRRALSSTRFLAAGALMLTASAVALARDGQSSAAALSRSMEAEAVLRVPAVDYRKEWVQLGTFSLLPPAGAQEIHVVYTARENADAYLKTGRFPDGAKLVKDIF